VLVRCQTGNFHNMQESAGMPTYLRDMREAWERVMLLQMIRSQVHWVCSYSISQQLSHHWGRDQCWWELDVGTSKTCRKHHRCPQIYCAWEGPEGREALTSNNESGLIIQLVLFLHCSVRMGSSFVLVSHIHSTDQVLLTVPPNLLILWYSIVQYNVTGEEVVKSSWDIGCTITRPIIQ
jgi:hypothetical protein